MNNFSPGLKRLHDKIFLQPRAEFNPGSTLLAEAGSNFNPGVELGPGLNILSCDRAFDFDGVLYYRQGRNFNPIRQQGRVQPRG